MKTKKPFLNLNLLLFFFIGTVICPGTAFYTEACSVPVFRYALERWKPDPYKGIYIYSGEMTEEAGALLDQLNNVSVNSDSPLNLIIKPVNADTFSRERLSGLLKGPVPDKLPVLAMWYPGQMGKNPPFLRESLTPSLVKSIIQSPKRKLLAESLINGASIVWVFIPSGNDKKDESALALIRKELDSALEKFKKNPFSILSGAKRKDLEYAFPVLTLRRDEPGEKIFLETLMKSEPDLYMHVDDPMVFPVFGRGRSLGALFGEYISGKNIGEATAFLSGACSCEVKDLNPGVDLLVAAPWDIVVMNSFIEDEPVPELTGVMPEPVDKSEIKGTLQKELEEKIPGADNSGLFKIYAGSLGVLVLIAVTAGFFIKKRRGDR